MSMDSLSANFFLWDSLCFEVFSEFQLFAQGWMGIDEGWIFGEWETGPWLGFRLCFFLQQLSNTQLGFFSATAIYLHRLCVLPVKLGLGQQRKKPEATAGLVSEMVLGATTWLVSWQ